LDGNAEDCDWARPTAGNRAADAAAPINERRCMNAPPKLFSGDHATARRKGL
jgi:hypothetical protein